MCLLKLHYFPLIGDCLVCLLKLHYFPLRGDSGLLLCPLSVERYYVPLFVDFAPILPRRQRPELPSVPKGTLKTQEQQKDTLPQQRSEEIPLKVGVGRGWFARLCCSWLSPRKATPHPIPSTPTSIPTPGPVFFFFSQGSKSNFRQ